MKRLLLSCVMVALTALTLTSCLRKSYDSPPDLGSYDPHLTTNLTVAQLAQVALQAGALGRTIVGDSTIAGIVVADDRSGNFYKQIVIEDSAGYGGITVLIDQNNLYADYPVGRRIYIKLKGLYVGTYYNLPVLGFTASATGIAKIPSGLSTSYIVKGAFPIAVSPKHYTLAQLLASPNTTLNTLVTIDSVEFATGAAGAPWAQPVTTSASTSLNVEDCYGNTIVLYNSGYANFQPYLTPTGKGSMTCIYSVYKTSFQLLMRDTTDFNFKGSRCGGVVVGPAPTVHIDSIRSMYNSTGGPIKLGAYKITGVITATPDSTNFSKGNYIIQDGNRAISVYYGNTPPAVAVGDNVTIDVTGDSVISYKGSLEIKFGSPALTTVNSHGNTVTPVTITIANLNTQYATAQMEYTLVKIVNATVTGGGTYSGSKTLNDGTGNLTMYTAPAATFSGQTVPATPKSFTGVVSSYSGSLQLQLRGPSIDVQ